MSTLLGEVRTLRAPGDPRGACVSQRWKRSWARTPSTFGQLPLRPDQVAGVSLRIALQVILVLGFGFPERAGRRDFGDHLARPQARGIDVGDGLLGDALLRFVAIEDRGAVAHAHVVALPVL